MLPACGQFRHVESISQGLTKLARDSLFAAMDDTAAFVKDAVVSAVESLPQLGREDFEAPQSAWQ